MPSVTQKADWIRSAFGAYTHDHKWTNFSVACPFCQAADPSYKKLKLVIHVGRWVYHCWRCGSRGRSLIPLLRKAGRPDLIEEYVQKFASQAERERRALAKEEAPDEKPVILPGDFRLLATLTESRHPWARRALHYLHQREVTVRDLWYYRFGISSEGDFEGRVIMPSHDAEGNLNYWTARRIDGKSWAKYKNPDAERNDRVFNEIHIDWRRPIQLVEGPFDMIRCPDNTIPLLGCQLNEQSLLFDRILQWGTPVTVCLDPGAARRANWIAKKLVSYGIEVRLADFTGYEDPGATPRAVVKSIIEHAQPWNRDDSIRSRIQAL